MGEVEIEIGLHYFVCCGILKVRDRLRGCNLVQVQDKIGLDEQLLTRPGPEIFLGFSGNIARNERPRTSHHGGLEQRHPRCTDNLDEDRARDENEV